MAPSTNTAGQVTVLNPVISLCQAQTARLQTSQKITHQSFLPSFIMQNMQKTIRTNKELLALQALWSLATTSCHNLNGYWSVLSPHSIGICKISAQTRRASQILCQFQTCLTLSCHLGWLQDRVSWLLCGYQ